MPHSSPLSLRRNRLSLLLTILVTASALLYLATFDVGQRAVDEGSSPTLAVSGDVKPGAVLTLTGDGFPAGQLVDLTWNGERIEAVRADADGGFNVQIRLPSDVAPGRHAVEAVARADDSAAVAHVTALGGSTAMGPFPPMGPAASSEPDLPIARDVPGGSGSGEADPATAAGNGNSTASHDDHSQPPAATPPPAPHPMPPMPGMGEHGGSLDCSGYPEPRVWVESQDWWSPIPELGGMGHMHMGMCFPVGQTVAGPVAFDLRVVLHHNAGTLTRIKMQDDQSTEHLVLRPNRAVGDGVYWFNVSIDTRNMPDGLRLFRFYADLEHPNGNRQTARPIFPLRVENGGADNNWSDRQHELRATAWYREANPDLDWGYVGAVIENYNPGPYLGTAAFEARCFVNGENGDAAASSPALSSWSVHVDPDFHAGNPGILIAQGSGQLKQSIAFQTGGLSHGWHRLVVRCNQVLGDREHAAVGVFSILVDH